jgi:hypothetical protein
MGNGKSKSFPQALVVFLDIFSALIAYCLLPIAYCLIFTPIAR